MSLEHTQTQTLVSALVERANRDPNAVAITFIERGEHRQITTGELLQETSRAAANLAAGGIGAGDLVILVLQHSLELIYSFCGAALLGAIPSIFPFLTEKLDSDLYRERVKLLVEHSGAKAVVTYSENFDPLSDLLNGLDVQVLDLSNVQRPMSGIEHGTLHPWLRSGRALDIGHQTFHLTASLCSNIARAAPACKKAWPFHIAPC